MARKFLKLVTSAALLSTVIVAPQMASAAPAPTLKNDNATAKFGDWYVGAIPTNVSYTKPVILFVQGLHSDYTTWYNSTDSYYDKAYAAGYRTAFVQLRDADGNGGNPWTNGPVLAQVIKKVRDYYGVSKINIIAHSKGGIDTQTALVHYGAYPYVNLVHQLSTPNKGSELADMAYSTWTGWLADIMGQKDDAVYSLQTSWMANYRAQTDGLTANNYTRTYMSGGTGDDGIFSSTYYSRAFLPGEDDGAVAIYSAFGNPKGVSSFTDNGSERLSHTKMRYGSKTWWQVQPKLTTTNFGAVDSNMIASKADLVHPELVSEESNKIMRGGAVNGSATDSFTLEGGLKNINIDVMTSSNATKVSLVSPSGEVYTATQNEMTVSDESVLFSNAVHNTFAISKPEKGEWKLVAEGQNDGYFMLATVDGGAKATLNANKKVHDKNSKFVDVTLATDNNSKVVLGKKKPAKLTKANKNGTVQDLAEVQLVPTAEGVKATLATPAEPGVYNLSFDITGVNAAGEEFTRSVNYNFAVTDENGKL